MPQVSIKSLIDLAIGSPDPGVINFNALRCLLHRMSDKIHLKDELIDIDSSLYPNVVAVEKSADLFNFDSEIMEEKLLSNTYMEQKNQILKKSTKKNLLVIQQQHLTEADVRGRQRAGQEQKSDNQDEVEEKIKLNKEQDNVQGIEQEDDNTTTATKLKAMIEKVVVGRFTKIQADIDSFKTEIQVIPIISQKLSATQEKLYAFEQTAEELKSELSYKSKERKNNQKVLLITESTGQTTDHEHRTEEQQMGQSIEQIGRDEISTSINPLATELSGPEESETFRRGLEKVFVEINLVREMVVAQNQKLEMCANSELHRGSRGRSSTNDSEVIHANLHEQLIELKTGLCAATVQLDELSTSVENLKSRRSSSTGATLIQLHQELDTLTDLVTTANNNCETLSKQQMSQGTTLAGATQTLDQLIRGKLDKDEIDDLLLEKADYTMLQRKVSVDDMEANRRKLEKQIEDISALIELSEQRIRQEIDQLKISLSERRIDEILHQFKSKIDKDIKTVREQLQEVAAAATSENEAAGARSKILRDLECISCDQECVMRAYEATNITKLRDAHATRIISPLVTYEKGNIRKSGIMGYFHKNEFPHAPHAWMKQECVPTRHTGGTHTIVTAKDRAEKIRLVKK